MEKVAKQRQQCPACHSDKGQHTRHYPNSYLEEYKCEECGQVFYTDGQQTAHRPRRVITPGQQQLASF